MPKHNILLSTLLILTLTTAMSCPSFAQDNSTATQTTQTPGDYEKQFRDKMKEAQEEKMKTGEKILSEQLHKLYAAANSTNSPDERNIKGFVLSTEVRTFKDIPAQVDNEIAAIRESIRWIIFQVATDVELSGDTGKLIYDHRQGIRYEGLPKDAVKKYQDLMEAKRKNNISVRSVQIAIQLLATINKQLVVDAERETDTEIKRKLYITQAAYIYEMADIVLDVLKNVQLEGKPVLEQIQTDSENRIKQRLSEVENELSRINRAKESAEITEKEAGSLLKTYALIKEANQTSLKAWDDLMAKVGKQEDWLNKMKKHGLSIELKRNAAKHQLDTLRDIKVIAELLPLVNMDDLVATIQDLELLELDNDTVLTLLFGTPVEKGKEGGANIPKLN